MNIICYLIGHKYIESKTLDDILDGVFIRCKRCSSCIISFPIINKRIYSSEFPNKGNEQYHLESLAKREGERLNEILTKKQLELKKISTIN